MSGKIFFVLIAFIGSLASYAASPTENVLNESAKRLSIDSFPTVRSKAKLPLAILIMTARLTLSLWRTT